MGDRVEAPYGDKRYPGASLAMPLEPPSRFGPFHSILTPALSSFCTHIYMDGTAVILALEGDKAAAIKWYGYPDVESKPLSDLTRLRAPPGGELAPGQATVGFECEVRGARNGAMLACSSVLMHRH